VITLRFCLSAICSTITPLNVAAGCY
jgi:hypothetical protein